jgi:hypothetical protein
VHGKGGNKPVRRPLDDVMGEFDSAISSVNQKPMKDEDQAYFVIEFQSAPMSRKYERILDQIQVNLLAFLDKGQKMALVASSYDIDKERITKEVGDVIKTIRDRYPTEIISEDVLKSTSNETVIINTIPNLAVERIIEHIQRIQKYINQHEGEALNALIDKENRRGSVIANVKGEVLEKLANESTIILSAYKVPETIMSVIRERRRKRKQVEPPVFAASSEESASRISTDSQFEIIEIDSGVKILQEFQGRVTTASALDTVFNDGEDKDNHGTPIASLLIFGQHDRNQPPRFKVRSYKAFEQNNAQLRKEDLYTAINYVLERHNGKSTICTSSINFINFDQAIEYETRKIELLIQSKNVCFVNSAGNISNAVSKIQNRTTTHVDLWNSNYVQHPADATSVVAVGSYCCAGNSSDGKAITTPSCFSRRGTEIVRKNIPKVILKPEVLEFGGNYTVDGAPNDQGVSMLGMNGVMHEHGTSFAAPLFARYLADIAKSLVGTSIKNCETIKAIAFSACKPTTKWKEYCNLGILHPDQFADKTHTAYILFEGEFSGMTPQQKFVHELTVYIPVHTVEATLIIVHSDNYGLPTSPGNYTYISVKGKKNEQPLLMKKGVKNYHGESHIRKTTYFYKKNAHGLWTFRLKPEFDRVPLSEVPLLRIRYGAVLKITTDTLPIYYASLKEAIEDRMKSLIPIGQSIK